MNLRRALRLIHHASNDQTKKQARTARKGKGPFKRTAAIRNSTAQEDTNMRHISQLTSTQTEHLA